ncbi:MAG: LysR family transcriptional regulator [Alphaproteobacteria bacterium]
MTIDEVHERRRLNEIADHASYFQAACLMKSIGGAATALSVSARTIFNHITWLEYLRGERLLKDVSPGRTMELTAAGLELMKGLTADFPGTIKMLDANKMDNVVGTKFVGVIKSPFVSR